MQTVSASFKNNSLFSVLCWGGTISTFIFAYSYVLVGLFTSWYQSDDYSHGFAIIPISLYVAWSKREELRGLSGEGGLTGLVIGIFVLMLYLVAWKTEMLTLASVSMVLFVWSMVLYLFGASVFRCCLFPLALLFLMIPVPAQLMASLTIPLQLLVTRISVMLASFIAIPVYYEGNIIHLPGGTFEVVQACSGLRSLMTMLTLGAVISYLTLRSNFLRGVLFLSGFPIAIAANIFRVFVLMVFLHFFNVNLSEGMPHTVLGIAVFGMTIMIFLLLRQGMVRWEK
jgi:exosortase